MTNHDITSFQGNKDEAIDNASKNRGMVQENRDVEQPSQKETCTFQSQLKLLGSMKNSNRIKVIYNADNPFYCFILVRIKFKFTERRYCCVLYKM